MIPDLAYTNRNFCTSNQISSKLIYLLDLDVICLYIRSFYHLVNALTDKAVVYIREKFLLYSISFFSLLLLRILESNMLYDLVSKQSVRKLTI